MRKEIIAEGIDYHGDKYVLCWLPARKEFANWLVGSNNSEEKQAYYLGRYFSDLHIALKDFEDRVKANREDSRIDWKVPAKRWNEAQVVLYFELDD